MKRMSVKRSKNHTARRAVIAAGTIGAATAGFRRWKHRHQPENVEG